MVRKAQNSVKLNSIYYHFPRWWHVFSFRLQGNSS